MPTTEQHGRFHLVCRDCRTERVYRSRSEARSFADDHGAKNGHFVVFDRVE